VAHWCPAFYYVVTRGAKTVFDTKGEPQTYEEMIDRARAAKERLGLIQKPKPVRIHLYTLRPEPKKRAPSEARTFSEAIKRRCLHYDGTELLHRPEVQEFIATLKKKRPDGQESGYRESAWRFIGGMDRWAKRMSEAAIPIRARQIIARFCEENRIPAVVLFSNFQGNGVVHLRFSLWRQLYEAKTGSYQTIGKWFGRDHSTVLYGVEKDRAGYSSKYVRAKTKRRGGIYPEVA
jgi:hypothetical protein